MNDSLNGCQSRERPRRAVRAAIHNPVTCTKKQPKLNHKGQFRLFLFKTEGLGMESHFSVYGIAEGVWHHRRCIFGLDSIQRFALIPFRLLTDSIHGYAVIKVSLLRLPIVFYR